MKTSEFKQAVEALGFTVVKEDRNLVINGEGSLWLADVSLKYKYALRIYFGAIDEVGEEKTRKLAEILFEYASTPLDEREEPKKWYLRDPVISDKHKNYLAISKHYKNVRHFGWETPRRDYQTKFTRAEIDAFEFEHAHLIEDEVK
ncbi:hypothetical protein HB884_12025, partial [Listeria booriae]|uniref:hypothetical protein n=1 Tax=Listeria booriae TaxID=1552123 RepID=UPI001624DC92